MQTVPPQKRPVFHAMLFSCATALLPAQVHATEMLIDGMNSSWQYLDNGTDPGSTWVEAAFDDSSWQSGQAFFSQGNTLDGLPVTSVNTGPDGAHYVTTYYRHHFNVADPTLFSGLSLALLRDDGVAVYINGSEVFRDNLPVGAIATDTPANSDIADADEFNGLQASLPANILHAGNNIIAVEIHQSSTSSDDTLFALELTASATSARGPYLQLITPTSAIIKWSTTSAQDAVVHYGTSADNLAFVTPDADPSQKLSHEVKLEGLSPATTYFYAIGSSSGTPLGSAEFFFKTQPPVGTNPSTRIWVIGDSGRGNAEQRAVYQGFKNHVGNTYTDLWLMLGDNAYFSGRDEEYQAGFFDIYPQLMRQTVVWPTFGNHDGGSADASTGTGPYFDIFALPKNAEAGGVASFTEAYYSYNYGNIHFVVLDSFDVSRSPTGDMAQWLVADLEANRTATKPADWIIAYWHHPPYTDGSHKSDNNRPGSNDIELVEMRENIVPILEQYGVDLVLCGHSHNYERSKFIQGHYGYSNTYGDTALYLGKAMALDTGSGNPIEGSRIYTKPLPSPARSGTVYAVAGTSAKTGDESINYPAMYRSLNELGSMIIDVNNRLLSAKFIDETGTVRDAFSIQKIAAATMTDSDGDGIDNSVDNCDEAANADQTNFDGDASGDACDIDDDNDSAPDYIDASPRNAANATERILPFASSAFTGALLKENNRKH